MIKKMILVALVAISFMGCATIISGSNQQIGIQTKPNDATVVIYDRNNMEVWNSQSPTTAILKRGEGFFQGASYRIEITKDGYEKQTINLTSSLNGGWYLAGNFLLGGLIGWVIVDPISGAMWSLSPKDINTSLKQSVSLFDKNDGLMIVLKEQIDPTVFESLELSRVN